jgi:hypothetical protein
MTPKITGVESILASGMGKNVAKAEMDQVSLLQYSQWLWVMLRGWNCPLGWTWSSLVACRKLTESSEYMAAQQIPSLMKLMDVPCGGVLFVLAQSCSFFFHPLDKARLAGLLRQLIFVNFIILGSCFTAAARYWARPLACLSASPLPSTPECQEWWRVE